ncbi:MAG: YggS family pyridoxal phosphate-dependent enzyme [Lentisphaerae bacterium]|nr:YggS family pyridoxal phosphate-dependent enzyme [Lentisphaerota bacterium]
MKTFAAEYELLRQEVDAAAARCSRDKNDISILPVSKTFPIEAIREAYDYGIRAFGENKVQELALKHEALPDDIEWHFIGHLQSNKAAKAVELAHWIHSVDSIKLLNKLNRHAGELQRRPRILIEVNSGEEAKSGVSYDMLEELVQAALQVENLELKGLMTMAPLTDDASAWQQAFAKLKNTRDALEKKFSIALPVLSMGMTGDFEYAIAEGSTLLRIGTRLFGRRG